jgi:predicted ATPase
MKPLLSTNMPRLCEAYPLLGYEISVLPKVEVAERANFILSTLGL